MTQLSQHLFGGGAGYLLRGIESRWKAAIPRLNPEAFHWLRGQFTGRHGAPGRTGPAGDGNPAGNALSGAATSELNSPVVSVIRATLADISAGEH